MKSPQENFVSGTEQDEKLLNDVFASILKQRQHDRVEQSERAEEWLEKRIARLPDRAKQDVRAYEKKLLRDGIAVPEKREEHVNTYINAFEQTYQDTRFLVGDRTFMLKKEYAKEQTVSWIKELLDEEPSVSSLKKIALLNFDGDGLKAVNDLSGSHEKGTEYIRRIAEALHDENSPVAKKLREQGITDILDVTGAGDEFSIVLKSKQPIEQTMIDEVTEEFRSLIASIDISDLLDFADPAVQERYYGDVREKKDSEKIPDSFTMRASVAGGGTTLFAGMMGALHHKTKPLRTEDDYATAINKIMGGMWDMADTAMTKNKTAYKESLRASPDPSDRFKAKVLARTTESRVLEGQIETMSKEIREKNEFLTELKSINELLKIGEINPEAYVSLVQQISNRIFGDKTA